MHTLLTALAVDRDLDRHRGGHRHHLADLDRTRPLHRRSARVVAAVLLTRVSLASAAGVRVLDACVADDLTRHLRASDGI